MSGREGEYFDTKLTTNQLDIQPTKIIIKKDPISVSTSWEYRIRVGNKIDFEKPLASLISIFEPQIDQINKLKNNYQLETLLQFVIDIDINPDASTPFFGLNKRTIAFLNNTETEVSFDLYKVD